MERQERMEFYPLALRFTNMKAKASLVRPSDTKLIERLAAWYHEVWDLPKERTLARLSTYPNEEVLTQMVVKEGNRILATGAVYYTTPLTIIFPEYKALTPWVTHLYTCQEYRKKGYGTLLIKALEEQVLQAGHAQVYLLAASAIKWYQRMGYKQIEKVKYKGTDTLVMEKYLE